MKKTNSGSRQSAFSHPSHRLENGPGAKNEREVGFDLQIEGQRSSCLKPQSVRLEIQTPPPPEAFGKPMFYKADALIGLSMLHLSQDLLKMNVDAAALQFCREAWQICEPHLELYRRSQSKVHEVRRHLTASSSSHLRTFETHLVGLVTNSVHANCIDLSVLQNVVDAIDEFENHLERPILYDFRTQFSLETTQRLQALFSFLFNLRALVGLDYNTTSRDSTYESVRMDSISDYIAKADYVANDGVLYQKISRHLDHLPAHFARDIKKNFWEYSHNAACLVDSLPHDFFQGVPQKDMSEALYFIQMNWLLGTEAGLLYRIREELYGLAQGYDAIFWPEINRRPTSRPDSLHLTFQITDQDLYPQTAAA